MIGAPAVGDAIIAAFSGNQDEPSRDYFDLLSEDPRAINSHIINYRAAIHERSANRG
jgi:hypothetical protein